MTAANFETTSYNGVSIIINTIDGYVNASQMCSSNGKLWRQYKTTKTWESIKNAFIQRYSEGVGIPTSPQNGVNKVSYYLAHVEPRYQGEYIHPKLVHFVAEYCSVDYAFTVSEIMDRINERAKLKKISDEENMKDVLNTLRTENEQLRTEIAELNEEIDTQATEIYDQSVRSHVNNKILTIYVKAGSYVISGDSTRKFNNVIKRWVFPASMNLRREICTQFNLHRYIIPDDQLNEVMAFIESRIPKE